MNRLLLRILLIFLLGAPFLSKGQFYTGSYQEFGKSRVQYQGFQWQSFNFQRFKVYFYSGGRDLAEYTSRAAYEELKALEKQFGYYIDDKLEIIVYNRLTDFRQSNIGINSDLESNVGGVTQLVGNKLFIYYEKDHPMYHTMIRRALAEVLVNHMLYGGNWKEVIKNAALLNLPEWFVNGFIAYAAEGWSVEMDNWVKDAILNDRITKFNHLEGRDAYIAGQAIWNYIAEKHGEKAITNIFSMTRVSRDIDKGLIYTINTNLHQLSNAFVSYYRDRYQKDVARATAPTLQPLEVSIRKRRSVYGFRISPDGRYAAWVTNIMGKYKVWVLDRSTGEQKMVYKREHKLARITDESFPVLAWHPTLNALAFTTERKGEVLFCIHTLDDGKTSEKPMFKLAKVLSMSFSPDGKNVAMSGYADGRTDIYEYNIIGNSLTPITEDLWDDLHPSYTPKGEILFSSNRFSDTIPIRAGLEEIKPWEKDYDIFMYDPHQPGRRVILRRITTSPEQNEYYPQYDGHRTYSFLGDRNGVYNRYRAQYDSAISHIDTVIHYDYFSSVYAITNYDRNILEYQTAHESGEYAFLYFKDNQYKLYIGKLEDDKLFEPSQLPNTFYRQVTGTAQLAPAPDGDKPPRTTIILKEEPDSSKEIDIDNYRFSDDDPEFEKQVIELEEELKEEEDIVLKEEEYEDESDEFELPTQRLYKRNFTIDYLVTQFDNNFLNASYQRYIGPGAVYFNPGINGIFKVGLTDVFEDYKVTAGFRLGFDLRSGEYLLQLEDLSGRVDHKYLVYRQSFQNNFEIDQLRVYTTEAKYQAKYPFTEVSALRGTAGYRYDREVFMAVDDVSLQEPNRHYHMSTLKLEYIFDNTIPKGLNLYNGTRLKLFGEYYQEFNRQQQSFFVLGLDIRHYQKIHKEIIWANRLSASTSFGDQKLLYYLGGVDNWIFRRNPSFDQDVRVDERQNYGFQTIATPMRGFVQNARNGNSFALINSEIRVPIVRYFANRPLRSDIWQNLQIIGFFDIGAAWTGANPYSDENSFNTTIIEQKPLEIEIQNLQEPIIWGYGFGVRTRIFGYFVRFDWAWGVNDYETQESIRYLSLTLDF